MEGRLTQVTAYVVAVVLCFLDKLRTRIGSSSIEGEK